MDLCSASSIRWVSCLHTCCSLSRGYYASGCKTGWSSTVRGHMNRTHRSEVRVWLSGQTGGTSRERHPYDAKLSMVNRSRFIQRIIETSIPQQHRRVAKPVAFVMGQIWYGPNAAMNFLQAGFRSASWQGYKGLMLRNWRGRSRLLISLICITLCSACESVKVKALCGRAQTA